MQITEEEYNRLRGDYIGICKSCKVEHHEVEPDARNYHCESCEEDEVFGVEELLMEEWLEVEEVEDANVQDVHRG